MKPRIFVILIPIMPWKVNQEIMFSEDEIQAVQTHMFEFFF